MITYLTISCITLCFCVITYLWVRHKRENKREVALADELIEDENGIIVTRRNYQEYYQTVRRRDSLHPFFQTSTHNVFPDEVRSKTDKLSPKKMMKVHTLEEPIGYSGENVMGEERAREWEEGMRERRRREQRMMVERWGVGDGRLRMRKEEGIWVEVRGHYR